MLYCRQYYQVTSSVVKVIFDKSHVWYNQIKNCSTFQQVSRILWLLWCLSCGPQSRLKAASELSQFLFLPILREENTRKTQLQKVKCWATVKLQSSELTLVTCDRLLYQTSTYKIKKHIQRDSQNICCSWLWDQVSQLVVGQEWWAGGSAVNGKVGN